MNHVSVSPTDGNGPTQGQRKTLTRVGNEPWVCLFVCVVMENNPGQRLTSVNFVVESCQMYRRAEYTVKLAVKKKLKKT